jgi:hypothetical protein
MRFSGGIAWRIAGAGIAAAVADGAGVGGAALAGALAVGWFVASCAGALCAAVMSWHRRRSATWVSEMARSAGALAATGDGTLGGEPVLVFAARGRNDPGKDVYDRGGRRLATGQPRGQSLPAAGPGGAWITKRARVDQIDFSDPTGGYAGSVMAERARGALVSSVTVTSPGGAELGEVLLTEAGITLRVGCETVGHLRQQSVWWRWILALELGQFTIQDDVGAAVGHITRTDRGSGGTRACNVIAYDQEASPLLRDLAPAIDEAVNQTLDVSGWGWVLGRFGERLIAWSDALEE